MGNRFHAISCPKVCVMCEKTSSLLTLRIFHRLNCVCESATTFQFFKKVLAAAEANN